MTQPRRSLLGLLLAALWVPSFAGAQPPDPRVALVQALGAFSLALDGAYGDEAGRIRSSLEAMARALERWDAQIQAYEAAMQADLARATPAGAARMHTALAGLYLERRRAPDALRHLTAAIERDPARMDSYSLLATAHTQLARDDGRALEALQAASALDPMDPVLAYLLAHHLARAGAPEDVVRAAQRRFVTVERSRAATRGRAPVVQPFLRLDLVQEATGTEPFFPPVRYAPGFALLRQGEIAEALRQFQEAVAQDPLVERAAGGARDGVRASAETSAAIGAFRDGDVARALAQSAAALERDPGDSELHRMYGLIAAAGEQYETAADALRSAVDLAPRDERARLALADVLRESGRAAAAEWILRETIDLLPGSGRAHYALGRLLYDAGRYDEAVASLESAAALGPLLGLNGIHRTIGGMLAAQQDFDRAREAYLRRVDLHPNDADAHFDLGDVLLKLGQHDEALVEFVVTLMLDPWQARAHAAIGQVHLREGRYDEAAAAARQALALDSAHTEAQYVVAVATLRLGRSDEGAREMRAYERLRAADAAAQKRQFELGTLRREAALRTREGDHEAAAALLRSALALDSSAASHLDLGLALLNAGRAREALVHLRHASAVNAGLVVHRHLADAYAAVGQQDESRRELALYEQKRREALRRRAQDQ